MNSTLVGWPYLYRLPLVDKKTGRDRGEALEHRRVLDDLKGLDRRITPGRDLNKYESEDIDE